MPLTALEKAGDDLVSKLQQLMPGATAHIQYLEL
jgi:hypothetical protein